MGVNPFPPGTALPLEEEPGKQFSTWGHDIFSSYFPGSRRKQFVRKMRKRHGWPGFVQATPGSQLRFLVFLNKLWLTAFEVVQTFHKDAFLF